MLALHLLSVDMADGTDQDRAATRSRRRTQRKPRSPQALSGGAVEELCRLHGYTVRTLEAASHVTQGTLSKIMSNQFGSNRPVTVKALAEAFGMSIRELWAYCNQWEKDHPAEPAETSPENTSVGRS